MAFDHENARFTARVTNPHTKNHYERPVVAKSAAAAEAEVASVVLEIVPSAVIEIRPIGTPYTGQFSEEKTYDEE